MEGTSEPPGPNPAPSSVIYETRPGCSGLHPPRSWKTSWMETSRQPVPKADCALGGKLDKSQIPSQTKKADTGGSLSHLLWVPYKKLQKLASNYVRKPATARPTLPTDVDFHRECPASLSPMSLLKSKTPLAKKALLYWYNVERETGIFLFPKTSSAHRMVF